jgi:hypothetical protein
MPGARVPQLADVHPRVPAAEIVALATSPPPRAGRYVTDDRGTRLYLKLRTHRKQVIRVVLHPLGDDTWRLASAYVIERGRRA